MGGASGTHEEIRKIYKNFSRKPKGKAPNTTLEDSGKDGGIIGT
jgi:hypothetical protein